MSNDFDHILLLDNYPKPQLHKHLTKHLIFCLNGTMELTIENEIVKNNGVFIESNVEHTILSHSRDVIVFLIEKTSLLSQEIDNKFLKGKNYSILADEKVAEVKSFLFNHEDRIKEKNNEILEICGFSRNNNSSELYEKRIVEVLNIIDSLDGISKDTFQLLSNKINLSKSRLSHLFKKEVGTSLSGYLVFQKMKKTYFYILKGMTLTEASLLAGFDSSAHFSATCKRMYGLSFSEFYKSIGG